MEAREHGVTREVGLAALGAALVLAGIYAVTLARGLVGGDTPELVTAAHVLGIPHEPGYPLYTLIGRLFALVPAGSGILRIHALSALAGALSASVLVLLLRECRLAPLAAVGLAVGAGLSRVTWSQAITAEVYTLGLFLGLTAVWLAVRWVRRGDARSLFLSAYVGGLAVGHQPLNVFLLPGIAWVLFRRAGARALPWRHVAAAAGWFALPFTVFIALPLRSMHRPAIDYAQIHTMADFFYQALGVASRSELLSEGHAGVVQTLRLLGETLVSTMGVGTAAVSVLALAGGVIAARRDREWLAIGGLPIVLIAAFAAAYQIHDIENYFILPVWLTVAMAGSMLAHLGPRRWIAGAVLGVILATGAVFANRVVCNRSSYHLVSDFVENTFLGVPERAALFLLTETQSGPFLCAQIVEGLRPDVKIVDMSGAVFEEDLGFRTLGGDWKTARWGHFEALYENPPPSLAGRPMCTMIFEARSTQGRAYEYRRRGIVFELVPRDAPRRPLPDWRSLRFRLPPRALVEAERTGFTLTPLIRDIYAELGLVYAEQRFEAGAFDEALELFRLVLDFEPRASAAHAGMAMAYARLGDTDAVERELRIVLEEDPGSVQALNGLGVVVLARGNHAEAEAFFRQAAEADPAFPLTWVNLGQALADDPSRRAEAVRCFERFLDLAPDDPDAGRVRELLAAWRAGG